MKKKAAVLIFFLIQYSYLYSQNIYPIPWASEQPGWVFPIFFEDAQGNRDTVYFGFDVNAVPLPGDLDSNFGETFFPTDTNLQAFFNDYAFSADSILKVLTFSDSSFFNGSLFSVIVNNAYPPLKVSWDNHLLYSDSIPCLDNDPLPRCQGIINWFYGWNSVPTCGSDYILITDTTLNVPTGACQRKDSVTIFDFHTTQKTEIALSIGFAPWLGYFPVGVEETGKTSSLLYSYNKSSGIVTITSGENISGIVCYDLSAHKIFSSNSINNKSIEINVSQWIEGLYIFKVFNDSSVFTLKLMIQK